ncbi:MAG: ATP-binding protein, partial [Oligoflexales bacterium]|nr:ATP-binding protein [Oligoflexales bacterium]
ECAITGQNCTKINHQWVGHLFGVTLLDNARNAQQQSIHPRIEVFWGRQGMDLFIQIRDFGQGMPAKVIDRLGEPFLSEERGGTSLGLFTAVGLVQSLGGVLKISNGKASGALVQILLPIEYGQIEDNGSK